VLDEAWTGLDQAARGALDAAVTERVAAGGTVLFVDHDRARLADRVDERWSLGGGLVTVIAGPTSGRCAAGTETKRPTGLAPEAAIIDLTGLEAGSVGRVSELGGVLAVSADVSADDDPVRTLGPVQVTVAAGASDSVLRELLSWDSVHVTAVRPSAERPAGGAEAGR
jgi:ABC-2 type transport system ATP-binding protein